MSHMTSEKSPRSLLLMAEQLNEHLNDLRPQHVIEDGQSKTQNTGFILKRVETIFIEIRNSLDCPYKQQETNAPLMLRLREHIDVISSVLTGAGVTYVAEDTTTLQELIAAVTRLNRSVCSGHTASFCVTM